MFNKTIFSTITAISMFLGSVNIALAVTYDLTGDWNVVDTITDTTCIGTDPIGFISYHTITATQSGVSNPSETWSFVDTNGESTSGTVTGTNYLGNGSAQTNSWSFDFDLLGATTGKGKRIEQMSTIDGPCQQTSSITLTKSTTSQKVITPDTPSSIIITPQALKATTTNIVNLVSKRIRATIGHIGIGPRQILPPSTSYNTTTPTKNNATEIVEALHLKINASNLGLSAGSPNHRIGVWGNIALSFSDNDELLTASSVDVDTYISGFDYMLSENLVTGFAISYDKTDATNTFNTGELSADSFSIIPYISFLINDYLSIDALYGHSWVDTDQTRLLNIKSTTSSRKDFFSASLNAYKTLKSINYTGSMTYTWAKEVAEGFNETQNGTIVAVIASDRTKFSQFALGLELSYIIKQFEPYVSIAYENDVTYTDIAGVAYDNEGGNFGLGVRMEMLDSLSGDLYYNQTINRDNLDEYTVSANMRYDF